MQSNTFYHPKSIYGTDLCKDLSEISIHPCIYTSLATFGFVLSLALIIAVH